MNSRLPLALAVITSCFSIFAVTFQYSSTPVPGPKTYIVSQQQPSLGLLVSGRLILAN